jgi:hypothetical protein
LLVGQDLQDIINAQATEQTLANIVPPCVILTLRQMGNDCHDQEMVHDRTSDNEEIVIFQQASPSLSSIGATCKEFSATYMHHLDR